MTVRLPSRGRLETGPAELAAGFRDTTDHPGFMGMRCDPRDMDLPASPVDEEQHVVRHQPPQCPDLSGQEVCGDEDIHVRADELLPGGRGLALWRWGEAVALQDVAHRLVTDGVAQVG